MPATFRNELFIKYFPINRLIWENSSVHSDTAFSTGPPVLLPIFLPKKRIQSNRWKKKHFHFLFFNETIRTERQKKKEEKILLTKKNLTGNFYTFFRCCFSFWKWKWVTWRLSVNYGFRNEFICKWYANQAGRMCQRPLGLGSPDVRNSPATRLQQQKKQKKINQ